MKEPFDQIYKENYSIVFVFIYNLINDKILADKNFVIISERR